MSESKTSATQDEQSTGTDAHESEQQAAERRAGKTDKSSHDHKSNVKAGSDEGAGGGAKQKQGH